MSAAILFYRDTHGMRARRAWDGGPHRSMTGWARGWQEMIIQLGYVNLFAAAFPLTATLALVNNLTEIRIDAYKLLMLTKRPPYRWSPPPLLTPTPTPIGRADSGALALWCCFDCRFLASLPFCSSLSLARARSLLPSVRRLGRNPNAAAVESLRRREVG